MERGESWLDPLPDTQVLYALTHTHTHEQERSTYSARYPHPPTTSTDYKPIQSRGLYFPRPCCQLGLITLPRFGLWQYNKTLRFQGMQDCLTKPWIYTYLQLTVIQGRQLRTLSLFQEQSASQSISFRPGSCQKTVGHRARLPALLKGKQCIWWGGKRTLLISLSSWLVKRLKGAPLCHTHKMNLLAVAIKGKFWLITTYFVYFWASCLFVMMWWLFKTEISFPFCPFC